MYFDGDYITSKYNDKCVYIQHLLFWQFWNMKVYMVTIIIRYPNMTKSRGLTILYISILGNSHGYRGTAEGVTLRGYIDVLTYMRYLSSENRGELGQILLRYRLHKISSLQNIHTPRYANL